MVCGVGQAFQERLLLTRDLWSFLNAGQCSVLFIFIDRTVMLFYIQ